MTTLTNPYKSAPAPSLLEQLFGKQIELEATTINKAEEATQLTAFAAEVKNASGATWEAAQLTAIAAEAKNASKVANSHAAAVGAAINILQKAGVQL